jgi:hypothetical protein
MESRLSTLDTDERWRLFLRLWKGAQTMKTKRLSLWILAALLVALLISPGTIAAKATRTECTGTEFRVEVLDYGLWTYPDGNIHIRGMVSLYQEESTCPEVGGLVTSTMNANWDSNLVGPIWGTGHSENEYGVWEGTWQGSISPDGSCSYRAVSHGISGAVAGLTMTLTANCTGEVTTYTATILDPHGEG